jgi:hypothetical protein
MAVDRSFFGFSAYFPGFHLIHRETFRVSETLKVFAVYPFSASLRFCVALYPNWSGVKASGSSSAMV